MEHLLFMYNYYYIYYNYYLFKYFEFIYNNVIFRVTASTIFFTAEILILYTVTVVTT